MHASSLNARALGTDLIGQIFASIHEKFGFKPSQTELVGGLQNLLYLAMEKAENEAAREYSFPGKNKVGWYSQKEGEQMIGDWNSGRADGNAAA